MSLLLIIKWLQNPNLHIFKNNINFQLQYCTYLYHVLCLLCSLTFKLNFDRCTVIKVYIEIIILYNIQKLVHVSHRTLLQIFMKNNQSKIGIRLLKISLPFLSFKENSKRSLTKLYILKCNFCGANPLISFQSMHSRTTRTK